MKWRHSIPALALAALLLAGCGAVPPGDTPQPPAEPPAPLSGTAGIGCTDDRWAWQDDWGVKLTVRDVTPTGLTLVCTQQADPERGIPDSLQTGSAFVLERLEDGVWSEAARVDPELDWCWTAEAWSIPQDDAVTWPVDWSALYGTLPDGRYRIRKQVTALDAAGARDTRQYDAQFLLVGLEDGFAVSAGPEGARVSVPYVDGWEYCVVEPAEDGGSFGVCWRPMGADGWVSLCRVDSFGVCGTGLKESDFVLNNGTAGRMGVYDGGDVWTFISFSAARGGFVAQTHGVDGWWTQSGDGAMAILKAADFPAPEENAA